MDLADATGLSTVHLNRTLQQLRATGLIALKDRIMTILDLRGLNSAAMFNPNYLHLRAGGNYGVYRPYGCVDAHF